MDIERIVVRLFADAAPYQIAMRQVEAGMLSFSNQAGRLGSIIDTPIKAATIATVGLAAATGALAVSALRMAANYETVAISLEVMTGSATRGRELLQDINKLAIETPFKSSGLATSAKELSAFGVQADQIIPTLKVLGDVASGVATDNLDEMMSRVILAFGQVKTAGRLMGPEARQFVQAGIPVYEYLAKVMGQPVQMMKQLTEEGQVGFGDLVKAFNMMTSEGGRFFNMMDRQSQTVAGRWSAVVETVELVLRDIGLAVFEGFGIKAGLDDLRKWLNGLKELTGNDLAGNLRNGLKNVDGTLSLIWFWLKKARDEVVFIYESVTTWATQNERVNSFVIKWVSTLAIVLVTVKAILLVKAAIVTVITAAALGLAFLASPLGIILIAVTAIVVALNEIGAFEGFGENFSKGLKEGLSLLGGIGSAFKDAFVAQDWELTGRIIGKGLEIGLMTAIYSIGAELTGVLLRAILIIGSEFELRMEKFGSNIRRSLAVLNGQLKQEDLAKKEAEDNLNAEKNWAARNEGGVKRIKDLQADMMKGLEPYKAQVAELQRQAVEARFKATDPMGHALNKMVKDNMNLLDPVSQGYIDRLNTEARVEFGTQFDIQRLPKELEKDPRFNKWLDDYEKRVIKFFLDKVFDSLGEPGLMKVEEHRDLMGLKNIVADYDVSRRAATAILSGLSGTKMAPGEKMDVPISHSAGVMKLSQDIKREMAKEQDKGIGFGAGQYTSFLKTTQLLKEGLEGPLSNPKYPNLELLPLGGAAKAGMPGVLSPDQYKFGMYREFQNLKRWVGVDGQRQPPAALQGSVEAQDIINRSMMGQGDKLDEMIAVLRAAAVIEEQQRQILETDSGLLKMLLDRLSGGRSF